MMTGEVTALTHIDRIEILDGRREINPAAVKRLANSINKIGLRTPVTVRKKGEDFTLVAGRHRIEAFKQLDRDMIPITLINKMTKDEARLWEISENLDRAELTKLERDENIAEWIRITDRPNASQVATHKKGQQPGGVNAAARDLGVDKDDAHRAVKVASLSNEAKAAAREHGLDDNRSALLAAAKETEPADQVARIVELATQKTKPKPAAQCGAYFNDDEPDDETPEVIAARGLIWRPLPEENRKFLREHRQVFIKEGRRARWMTLIALKAAVLAGNANGWFVADHNCETGEMRGTHCPNCAIKLALEPAS